MADETAAIRQAMQLLMKRNQENPNSGERPPNLRLSEDPHENCGNCEHFKEGRCTLYSYRVTPEQVCDSWTPIPEGGK